MTLVMKTRNIQVIANVIEKKAKAGLTFEINKPWSDNLSMGCIGAVIRDYIKETPRLQKKFGNIVHCRKLIQEFLGLPALKIWIGGNSTIWGKYDCEMPNAKQAATMLRNLASGKWNFDDYQFWCDRMD